MDEEILLQERKLPNGQMIGGRDNRVFQDDRDGESHDSPSARADSGVGSRTTHNTGHSFDFDGWQTARQSSGGTDDEYSDTDSGRSQHDDEEMLDDRTEGGKSRMTEFDDEPNDNEDKPWDVFEETAWENLAHADREFWTRINKISRVGLCIFLFLFILGASSLGNFAFLVIVYNMNAAFQNFTLPSGQVLKAAGDSVNVRWVWAAIMVTCAPYLFTLWSCIVKLCVKRTRALELKPLLMALCLETVHSVGLGVFVFVVAPSYDPLMVIVLNQGVAFIPAFLQVVRVKHPQMRGDPEETRFSLLNCGVLGLTAIFIGLVVWRIHLDNVVLTALTPLCLVFLSVEWWENFVVIKSEWKKGRREEMHKMRRTRKRGSPENEKQMTFEVGSKLFRAKYAIRDNKIKIEAVCTIWKIFLNLIIPLVVFAAGGDSNCASVLFFTSDKAEDCTLWNLDLYSSADKGCLTILPFIVAAVAILASGLTFKAAKVACKIHAQRLCFAAPLLLSAPLTFVVSVLTYRHPLQFADCPNLSWPLLLEEEKLLSLLKEYVEEYWLPLILLGLIVLGFSARHVWTPSAERVATTDKLFVRPLYCGVMFVQSLLLNRAVDDDDTSGLNITTASRNAADWTVRIEQRTQQDENKVDEEMRHSFFPRIYACATMWHETAKEMTQLLKSLFRMDQDQFTRACMWKRFNVVDKDFYLYEAHIFFDDAFTKEKTRKGNVKYTVNSFVNQLLSAVEEAAKSIYPSNVCIPPPIKADTPYGGQLTYTLPGGNPLVVHLKNKFLIRHKKRWSQVMYMYYLLSYKLLLGKHSGSKKRLADNTFLLALDGDVDFYPDSVQLLVDRMRRNHHVGAACGRIHPVGSGLMVWYQRFEYAISHWLQKATEHIFGCVLCSPGCFSLFRGSALMEDNVLRRYTKVATRARHAVQYDMGEDRWLCTLLLQQGKRVEYAAAADALTFCPDDFGEFYKQRRRWTPSTMANILDLLSDWRHVTKVNGSISILFIFYQGFLFVSSVLTPGTIFLLILGAINTAYPTLPLYGAMILNLLPIIIFLFLCFYASSDVQIAFATLLSTVYSLVMMIVLVGLLRQVAESGMCSVTAIFFVGVAGIFTLAGLFHPQEVGNLLFGLLYFLAIPSTSMLLIFYAVSNINVVSWGTRDTSKTATSGGQQEQNTLQKVQGGLKRMISFGGPQASGGGGGGEGGNGGGEDKVTSDYTFSFGNLFRCICCPRKKENSDVMERFEGIENALYDLRRAVKGQKDDDLDEEWTSNEVKPSTSAVGPSFPFPGGDKYTANPAYRGDDDFDETDAATRRRNSGFDPFEDDAWFEDPKLDTGALVSLSDDEHKFWEELISKYLEPLDHDPEHKHKEKKIAEELTALRNKASMLFFLSNALFVTIIFILESVSEYTPDLSIRLPCDKGHAGQKLEPISVTFTVIFGILLILQLGGMLLHRFSTFVHIVAATSVRQQKRGSDSENYSVYGRNEFYDLTRDILYMQTRAPSGESTHSESFFTGDMSLSRATSGTISHNIMSKLIKRQQTRGHSLRRQNLYDVVDESLHPMIDIIDQEQATAGGEEAGGAAGGSRDEEAGTSKGDDWEDRGVKPVREGLKWLGGHSMKAVMSLAQDPEKRKLIRQRTERARDNWQKTVDRVKHGTVPKRGGFGDVVKEAMQQKKKSTEAGADSNKQKVTRFDVSNEISHGAGARFPTRPFKSARSDSAKSKFHNAALKIGSGSRTKSEEVDVHSPGSSSGAAIARSAASEEAPEKFQQRQPAPSAPELSEEDTDDEATQF